MIYNHILWVYTRAIHNFITITAWFIAWNLMANKNDKQPHEEILLEDLKDMDNLLQSCIRDIETFKNKSKIFRELLVMARDNLDEAIRRIDKMVEELG